MIKRIVRTSRRIWQVDHTPLDVSVICQHHQQPGTRCSPELTMILDANQQMIQTRLTCNTANSSHGNRSGHG